MAERREWVEQGGEGHGNGGVHGCGGGRGWGGGDEWNDGAEADSWEAGGGATRALGHG